jgi:hypothetical protein
VEFVSATSLLGFLYMAFAPMPMLVLYVWLPDKKSRLMGILAGERNPNRTLESSGSLPSVEGDLVTFI